MERRLSQILRQLQFATHRGVEYSRPNMALIGVMAVIGFPLFYIIWGYWFPQPYENLWVRLLGSLIYFPLIFHKQWPKYWQQYLPHYWAFAILYGLCFFFSFMLFKNDLNEIWTLSAMAGAVLLVFVSYDWLILTVFYIAGLLLAGLVIVISGDAITSADLIRYAEQLPIYLFVFWFGAAFNQSKERLLSEKHETALGIGGAMAHEIRTPLISIRSAADGFKHHLPTLMQAYEFARQHDSGIERIHPMQYRQLAKIPDAINREIDYANAVIDMLLFNSNNDYLDTDTFQHYSIAQCVEATLANYPFKEKREKNKVQCDLKDFLFWGNESYLRNILFNLINNALYFIAEAKKGRIEIFCGEDHKYHYLCFKDTGKGIKAEELVDIFSPFYTKGKIGGTGIGLSFCKQVMLAFKGDITCRSAYGAYTEFKLSFPKIKG